MLAKEIASLRTSFFTLTNKTRIAQLQQRFSQHFVFRGGLQTDSGAAAARRALERTWVRIGLDLHVLAGLVPQAPSKRFLPSSLGLFASRALVLYVSSVFQASEGPKFVQSAFKKFKFLEWVRGAIQRLRDANHAKAEELQEVFDLFGQPLALFKKFRKETAAPHDDDGSATATPQTVSIVMEGRYAAWLETEKEKHSKGSAARACG